jgi:hypothetical protein
MTRHVIFSPDLDFLNGALVILTACPYALDYVFKISGHP